MAELVTAIGIGSNLGDRAATIASAVEALRHTPGIEIELVSALYETPPVGPPQPAYLNAAARARITIDPDALMDALLAIEAAHGRVRREKWGPRTLDLDVLVVCDPTDFRVIEVDTDKVRAPHPHLTERSFALAPLLDVLPELAPLYQQALTALGGPPPRARRSQSIVVPGRHR
jgi:2-amino-4-hydroxy-6-hydroxymethyldihydropteridine diphosphokinase